ncbi:MAG: LytTR family DNA-binding domain-containing protein [Bacteroidota bacterium]
MKIKTIIVDDEFHCRENLLQIIEEFVPNVDVVGMAKNANEARELISRESPELVFLDIKMPQESGFELLESLPEKNFSVIFTTAHNEYGIEAIKAQAVDYLEKPIMIEDLKTAVERVHIKDEKAIPDWKSLLQEINQKESEKVSIPTKDGFIYVDKNEIIHLEASDSYTFIYLTNNRKHLSSKNIKVFEKQLGDESFYRIHKSHIINVRHHLKEFSRSDGNMVLLSEGRTAPVSRRKLSDFLGRVNSFSNVE